MKKTLMFSLLLVSFLMIGSRGFADISYPVSLNKEVRCYPHAQITQTLDTSDIKMATLLVTDRFSNILGFYIRELHKMGWKIGTVTEEENRVTIRAEKEGKSLLINAKLNKSGDSTIQLTMDLN